FSQEYILNSRGLKLFTCSWIPTNQEPKALIFICHGYAMECSITMNSISTRFAKAGFAVYGIDYQGHGKSAGLQGYIDQFDNLVDDCTNHFTTICKREENKGRMRYLLGESMGGALALLLHRKKPNYWGGAVLVAPMCRIADEMRPPKLLITLLSKLCKLIPTWKSIPLQDVINLAFKEPEIKQEIRANPYCYKGPPRLKTAYELFRISQDVEQRLNEVSVPFIILHGGEDKVTDQRASKQLYNVALSKDKTLKLYPGMWHGLLYGETPKNIDTVFTDMIHWLNERADFGNSTPQRTKKLSNDIMLSV
ncbi:Hydrolase_4 domain-containing protein, partial [Cephalotus follicularis]